MSRHSKGSRKSQKSTGKSSDNAETKEQKIFSDVEIREKLGTDYIFVHPGIYDHIPVGAHIRYFKVGDEPRNVRFRIGGFVRGIYADEHGKKYFKMSKSPVPNSKYQWRLFYETIDQLFKKYNYDSYIEVYLISASLAEKKQQIERLLENQKKLLARVDELAADIKLLQMR